jgi:hypothetical protein
MAGARRTALSVVLTAVVLVVAACGSAKPAQRTHVATSSSATSAARPRSPAARRRTAPPASVAVIKGWASALQRGDVVAAARYFHLPSVFVDGPGAAVRIRTFRQAEVANAALPCGARFVSASVRGPYVNVLFKLTGRPGPGGSTCGTGVGTTARTNFLIRSGRISVWLRAPDQPGDNAGPSGSPGGAGPTV